MGTATKTFSCAVCGCNDVSVGAGQVLFGKFVHDLSCNHCGHSWVESTGIPEKGTQNIPVVKIQVLRCPHCQGTEVKVQKKMNCGVRYYLCETCGGTFKAICQ
jgi:hypothetical protein